MEKAQLALAGIAVGLWLGAVINNTSRVAALIWILNIVAVGSEITKYL